MRETRRGFFSSDYTTAPGGGMTVIGKTYYCERRRNWGNILGLIALIISILVLTKVLVF